MRLAIVIHPIAVAILCSGLDPEPPTYGLFLSIPPWARLRLAYSPEPAEPHAASHPLHGRLHRACPARVPELWPAAYEGPALDGARLVEFNVPC